MRATRHGRLHHAVLNCFLHSHRHQTRWRGPRSVQPIQWSREGGLKPHTPSWPHYSLFFISFFLSCLLELTRLEAPLLWEAGELRRDDGGCSGGRSTRDTEGVLHQVGACLDTPLVGVKCCGWKCGVKALRRVEMFQGGSGS